MPEQTIQERRLEILKKITSLPTAPGAEDAVARWISDFAQERGLAARPDRHGNVLVHYLKGPALERPPAFCAHMDHPGFRAASMDGARRLNARFYGGILEAMLSAGAGVRFFCGGRWVHGAIAEAPREKRDDSGGWSLAVGLSEDADIPPGSPGMWDFPDTEIRAADDGSGAMRLFARGHDDLAGVASIACLIEEAAESNADGEFYALFTRAEEDGFLGAIAACKENTLPRRCVILALEASKALIDAPVGGGAIVRVGDQASIFTPWVSAWLWEAARGLSNRIPPLRYRRKLMDGGTCETTVFNAWGYEAGGLCLPLGNYHNIAPDGGRAAPEYIDPEDFNSLASLLVELALNGPKPSPSPGDMRERLENLFERRSRMLEGEII